MFPWNSEFGGPAYIEQNGLAIAGRPPDSPDSYVINLHLPSIVAKIITTALENGWSPNTLNKPFFIPDGYLWLKEIEVVIGQQYGQAHTPEELPHPLSSPQVEDCPSI